MHIVIVGGGFAGIRAALELSRRNLGRITLISEHPHFLNRTTLYSAATKTNEAESVLLLDEIFAKHHDITVVQDRLVSIDPDRRLALGKHKGYPYDKLILALGSVADYANIPGANKHTYDIRTLDHVRALRKRIHKEMSDDKHGESIYTVVGAGSTGVELAASLASYVRHLTHTYNPKHVKVHIGLMERESRILPGYAKSASKIIERRLRELGVNVMKNHDVTKVDARTVIVGKHKLPSETTIWATGVQNNPFYRKHPTYFQLDKYGNVMVNPYLEAYKNIYVLGDNANVHFVSSAHIAIDMGSYIARHLARVATDRPLKPFRARQHMTSIPVGPDWAYTEYLGIYTKGSLGHHLRRRQILKNYRQIISKNQALRAWNSYNKYDET